MKVYRCTSSAKSVRSFKEKACSFTGDRAKGPVGMKTRLARSLGGFCTSWTKKSSLGWCVRQPSWGIRVSSFSSRVLAKRNMGRKEESVNCVVRELVLSKSRICSELGTFLWRGWRRRSSKVRHERRGPLPSDLCLRVHTGPVCNVSRCWKNDKCARTLGVRRRSSSGSPWVRERRQEVARFCGSFDDGTAGDFAAKGCGLCHQRCEFVCSCWSCIYCQLFFERVLSARTLRDQLSIIDREPQERVSPRNRPHCYIGKVRWKEQRSRRVVLAL